MTSEMRATMTSKGQITVPVELRRQWQLKPGDEISFTLVKEDQARIAPRSRRSIFDRVDELALPAIGRKLTRSDISAAAEQAMHEKAVKRAKNVRD
jgi:AbrB family looped-hinge helix DNA binding protein